MAVIIVYSSCQQEKAHSVQGLCNTCYVRTRAQNLLRQCESCGKNYLRKEFALTNNKYICCVCFEQIKDFVVTCYQEKFLREIPKLVKTKFGIDIHYATIRRWLKYRFNTTMRTKSERKKKEWFDNYKPRKEAMAVNSSTMSQTMRGLWQTGWKPRTPQLIRQKELMHSIEQKFGEPAGKVITEQYSRKLSFGDLETITGVDASNLYRWSRNLFKIKIRSRLEAIRTPRSREKNRLTQIINRITQNQIGPITSAFLSDPTGQFQILTPEEIYSAFLDKRIKSSNIKNPKDLERNFLIRLAQKGSIEARNKVTKDHLQLIDWVIRNKGLLVMTAENTPFAYDDLFSVGVLALFGAIDRCRDPKNFVNYAITVTHREIQNYFNRYHHLIRIPFNQIKYLSQLKKTELTSAEIIQDAAKRFGVRENIFYDLYSTDCVVGDDHERIGDLFVDEHNSIFKLLGTSSSLDDELWCVIEKVVGKRNAEILRLRFHGWRLKEIANEFDINWGQNIKQHYLDGSIEKLSKSPEFLEFVRENYGIK